MVNISLNDIYSTICESTVVVEITVFNFYSFIRDEIDNASVGPTFKFYLHCYLFLFFSTAHTLKDSHALFDVIVNFGEHWIYEKFI